MHGLTGAFWWVNTLLCAYCTLYWTRKRLNDGTPMLMTPGGQFWAWQLLFCFVIYTLSVSPWHLFWLAFVSLSLSVVVSNAWRGRMLAARYPNVGVTELSQVVGTVDLTAAESAREDFNRVGWMERTVADRYLADDLRKEAFFTFIRESPAMKLAFHHGWGRMLTPERPLTRGRLTLIFNDAGVELAALGDSEGSDRSFACSCLLIKGNPFTWAALAEVAFKKEDRMAATWAAKVIKFRLQKNASPELREFLSDDEAKVILRFKRARMRQIVSVCEASTWWHNSAELFKQMGVAEAYFDR